jgi:hypothetical protein
MNESDLDGITGRYRQMSESELMDLARKYDELAELAQALLRAEFSRRSLEPPLIDDPGIDVAEGRNLVTIRTYRDLPEAFIARSVLENAGIECFLQDENTVRMDWLWSNMIGGARLQVAQEDEAAAIELLSQPIPTTVAVDTGADFIQPACPKCASLDVIENDAAHKIGAASLFLAPIVPLAVPAMSMQRDDLWKCNTCGCTWYDDESDEPGAPAPVN